MWLFLRQYYVMKCLNREKEGNRMKKRIYSLLSFVAEAGMLKRVKRSGWWVLGISNSESVADRRFRCAVLGYILAKLEKVPPYKVLLMTLFNDIQEARITDLHKMSQRYINFEEAEERAFTEQINSLPNNIKEEMLALHREYRSQESKESIIARDADILECLLQAKEYCEYGFREAAKFMKKAPQFLKTKSARFLWKKAKEMDLNKWWENFSGFER